jgi:Helix-turn-helix domain
MAEREEISRGVAAGEPCRPLAARLGRAPSTGSRELARDGGRGRYRLRSLTPLAAGGPSGQAGQAGDRASGGGGGGGQAGPAVVARADRRLAAAGLPREDPVLGCRTRPSTCRCWSTAAGRLAASSSVAWARVGHALPADQAAAPGTRPAARHPPPQPATRRRPLPERCPAIGKATWWSASDPARSGPGWSATAARGGCSPPQPLHRTSHAPSADRRRLGLAQQLGRSLTWDQGRELAEHPSSPSTPASRSSAATRAARGSAAPTRTPPACWARACPSAPTCASSTRPPWTPSPPSSTAALDNPWGPSHPPRHSRRRCHDPLRPPTVADG